MNEICVNGVFLPADQPVFHVSNRGYRYGDGLFETLKVKNNRIIFEKWHFERLFKGLQLIELSLPAEFTPEKIAGEILQLCERNQCSQLARVRLSVNRGNGSPITPDQPQYTIECEALKQDNYPDKGFTIDIFELARKSCDRLANLKSANYQPYAMAARFAKRNQLDDALVLNVFDRIADSSIANIFIVKGKKLYTPSLAEGCIAGIIRRWVIKNFDVTETKVLVGDILTAEEIFLTNAIKGVRWVTRYRDKNYSNAFSSSVWQQLQDQVDDGTEVR